MGIVDAHAPLFGRIDQKNPAERPERLAAKRLLRLLIENDDLLLRVDQFRRGDQPGKSGTDDNYVRVKSHLSPLSAGHPYRELDAGGTRSEALVRCAILHANLIATSFAQANGAWRGCYFSWRTAGTTAARRTVISNLDQDALARMIGTTRSRVNFFMNKFRDLGYIEYDSKIVVHDLLSRIVSHQISTA